MKTATNLLNTPQDFPNGCLFCRPKSADILHSHELALALTDNYPVVKGHFLVVPKRHAPTWFDLTADEVLAINDLLQQSRETLMSNDPAITGFNIGANAGPSAGQSVFHCHVHVFPRRDGDQENPRGGVRRIFPDKALYEKPAQSRKK